jgi:hypothetical protein
MKRIIWVVFMISVTLTSIGRGGELVAYYEFENDVNDSIGSNHGTAFGGPTFVSGKKGNWALHFDGIDDYVQIPRSIQDSFSIAFWVKTTQVGGTLQGQGWLYGKGLVDGDVLGTVNDFGTSLVGYNFSFGVGNPNTTAFSTTSISDDNWQHVVATRDASNGTICVYVNGLLEDTKVGPTASRTAPPNLCIGKIRTLAYYFRGDIDDVRLYDYVLSLSEIQTLAEFDTDPPTPNPATWAVAPHAISSDAIVMTASIGTDPRGIVKYYFQETSGNPGGDNSGWISSPTYTDFGLKPMKTYTYVVRMRDAFGNTTVNSQPASATTAPVPDINQNNFVNMVDFAILAKHWLDANCLDNLWCGGADLDMSGDVSTPDVELFTQDWLKSYDLGHFYTWATTPPMGWNSYDCYGYCVREYQVKENADFMNAHLKQYGWQYVVIDFAWYVPDIGLISGNPNQGSNFIPHSYFDEYGRFLPDPNRFPSSINGMGFKPLADYVHSLGLKFGIHLMRGIPREVVALNLPIKGTAYTASEAADTSSICSWYNLMYGLDMSQPAAEAYLNSIFELYASWGVDFVKIDDLSASVLPPYYYTEEIEGYRNAIDGCGRPMVLSTSPGPTPFTQAAHISANANMWRQLNDLWDSWSSMNLAFDKAAEWYGYIGIGHWPDLDMLPMGKLSKYGPNGPERYSYLTENQCYMMMSLWCITRSPLMFGGNLPENTAFTTSLITNPEVIAVSQNSTNNQPVVVPDGNYPVWVADVPDSGNDKYLAVFNRTTTGPTAVTVTLSDIGVKRCLVRDLWTHTDLGEYVDTFSPQVNSRGARLFKLTVLETAP